MDRSLRFVVVPTLTSSKAEAVTLMEISISFSKASHALVNSNIDVGSGSLLPPRPEEASRNPLRFLSRRFRIAE